MLTYEEDIDILMYMYLRKADIISCFNEDRATLNEQAAKLDMALQTCGFDAVLQEAFEDGMNLDEISYVLNTHTERTVRRYIVQAQLKRAANKDK